MKKLYFLIILGIVLISNRAFSQAPFSRVFYYDTSNSVEANSIIASNDNQYMLAGDNDQYPLAIKMDTLGNLLWAKTFDCLGIFRNITIANDSSCIFVGKRRSLPGPEYNIFCASFDNLGDTLWTSEIDFGEQDYAYGIDKTYDNGYIISGYTTEAWAPDSPDSKIIIMKLDSSGNIMWGKGIKPTNMSGVAYSIKQMPDSGYIATGFLTDTLFKKRFFLLKLDSSGNINWFNINDTIDNNYGLDLIVSDSNIVCYLSSYNNCIVVKTDFFGNVIWSKRYNSNANYNWYFDTFYKIHKTSDNGFLLNTYTGFLKIDSVGNQAWGADYFVEPMRAGIETLDKGYILVGKGPQQIVKYQGGSEVAIIKTDSLGYASECFDWNNYPAISDYTLNMIPVAYTDTLFGNVIIQNPQIIDISVMERNGCIDVWGNVNENNPIENGISIYPNPTTGKITMQAEGMESVEVINLQGKQIYTGKEKEIDISHEPKGIYIIKVQSEKGVAVEKVILH